MIDEVIPRWAGMFLRIKNTWTNGPDPKVPYFEGPIRFVHPPKDDGEPFMPHNHVPSITWLDNGDLLACFISTRNERGPELTVLASRLRKGADEWDPSSEFFKAPDRNVMHPCLSRDKDGTIYHFNGMTPEREPDFNMALMMRTSKDNGVTWTAPQAILPEYSYQHMSQWYHVQNIQWFDDPEL